MGILKLGSGSKTRLQDFIAIFSFKAAALAVGERLRQQLQKFCAEFSRRKPQKNGEKVFAERLGCARL